MRFMNRHVLSDGKSLYTVRKNTFEKFFLFILYGYHCIGSGQTLGFGFFFQCKFIITITYSFIFLPLDAGHILGFQYLYRPLRNRNKDSGIIYTYNPYLIVMVFRKKFLQIIIKLGRHSFIKAEIFKSDLTMKDLHDLPYLALYEYRK